MLGKRLMGQISSEYRWQPIRGQRLTAKASGGYERASWAPQTRLCPVVKENSHSQWETQERLFSFSAVNTDGFHFTSCSDCTDDKAVWVHLLKFTCAQWRATLKVTHADKWRIRYTSALNSKALKRHAAHRRWCYYFTLKPGGEWRHFITQKD